MINELVHKAMALLLVGDDAVLAALRCQYKSSHVGAIEFTGGGAYIDFAVPESAVNLPQSLSFCFGDIEGTVKLVNYGIGFLLWVKNGKLSFLEIYTYMEHLPNEIVDFSLDYIGGKRDLEELRQAWS